MHPAEHTVLTWQKESQDEGERGALMGTPALFCHIKMELNNPKCPRTPVSAMCRLCALVSVWREHLC